MKKVFLPLVIVAIAGLLMGLSMTGCKLEPTPAPQAVPGATATPLPTQLIPVKETWEEKWNKMVVEAKKEGSVTIYTTYPSELRVAMAKGFKDKFGLNIEFVTGRGAELREKLFSERRAGLYLADIYMMGPSKPSLWELPGTIFDPIPPVLMLPEVVDGKAWVGDKINFGDARGEYVVFFGLEPSSYTAMNINLVKSEELQSVQDLLNPKYKRKIVLGDPTTTGSAMTWFGAVVDSFPDVGIDFMKNLAKQEPVITRDQRLAVEWVAREKHAIAIGITPLMVNEFINLGAPLEWAKLKETFLAPRDATFALINNAAHPDAAKIFINWFLSKEGQTLYSKASGVQSARVDVDTSHIPSYGVRDPAKKYVVIGNAASTAREDDYAKMAKEVFKDFLQ